LNGELEIDLRTKHSGGFILPQTKANLNQFAFNNMSPHLKHLVFAFVVCCFWAYGSAQLITVCGGSSIIFPCQNGGPCNDNQWTFQRCITNGTFEVINPEGNCGLTPEEQLSLGIGVGAGGAVALALGLGLGIGIPKYMKRKKGMEADMIAINER
jgi:hypothetical protein